MMDTKQIQTLLESAVEQMVTTSVVINNLRETIKDLVAMVATRDRKIAELTEQLRPASEGSPGE